MGKKNVLQRDAKNGVGFDHKIVFVCNKPTPKSGSKRRIEISPPSQRVSKNYQGLKVSCDETLWGSAAGMARRKAEKYLQRNIIERRKPYQDLLTEISLRQARAFAPTLACS